MADNPELFDAVERARHESPGTNGAPPAAPAINNG
jgi:hypothetical protein